MQGTNGGSINIPKSLVDSHATFFGDTGRAWIDALPGLIASLLERWSLRLDGPPATGAVALVFPVVSDDGSPAVLKLQPVDDETAGEPIALRAWNGRDAVTLLRYDVESGSMLLERLDASRSLATVPDDHDALRIIAGMLVRLHAVPPPAELRRLGDIANGMLERAPQVARTSSGSEMRHRIATLADAIQDVADEPGSSLLHWDLHYTNVLAPMASSGRSEAWVAIDPKPLIGDPGFDLLPALHNRWDAVVTSGDPVAAVLRRFDLMTEIMGLDRQRAARWTLARILQNTLWEVEARDEMWSAAAGRLIAGTLLDRYVRSPSSN